MTATMTTTTSPPPSQQAVSSPNLTVLPPLVTDTPVRLSGRQRSSSYGKDRLSTFSNLSVASQNRSRPGSHVFPIFHSSLPYALVRDFAYPISHPLHYGPLPPSASGLSSPVSEQRRLSDPPASWDSTRGQWSTQPWGADTGHGHQQLPAMSFGDGPPYSEDEDLHSPVFSAPRHRKTKSTGSDLNGGASRFSGYTNHPRHRSMVGDNERGTLISMNSDGSETYYVNDDDDDDDGPGGDLVTYPPNESRFTYVDSYKDNHGHGRQDELDPEGTHRYSREFQFSVGCPDEEMHGKAVALFDFTREHENELPLAEGQVIFVSYRHGQGWLVAEDPRSGESGLVPEEFVRLVRDIEGGLNSLNGEAEAEYHEEFASPESTGSQQDITPTSHTAANGEPLTKSKTGNENVMNTAPSEADQQKQ